MKYIMKISLILIFMILLIKISSADDDEQTLNLVQTAADLSLRLSQNTTLEIPSNPSIKNYRKLAGVYFIEGAYDNTFFSACSSSFNKTCSHPETGSGYPCNGLYEKCECLPKYKYEIAADCPTPQEPDKSSEACGNKYSQCKCSAEYTTTCVEYGASPRQGAVSCNGLYKPSDCVCPPSWKTKCENSQTPSGKSCHSNGLTYYEACKCSEDYFLCSNGPQIGAKSCTDDEGTKYSECKGDCENKGTLTACPSGYLCTYENCSGKYYLSGCSKGYIDVDSCWCNQALRCFLKL